MGQSFSFALFALVGSLAGIFAVGKVRARTVLLAMGGFVAAANLISITAIQFLNAERIGWSFALEPWEGWSAASWCPRRSVCCSRCSSTSST